MKKLLCAVFIILALFLSACGAEEDPAEPSPTQTAQPSPSPKAETDENVTVLSKGTGFLITEVTSNSGTKYAYTVTANDGKEIESASCGMQPKVAPLAKDLIGIRFYSDKGSWCRYYDLERGIASQSFYGAFWDDGSLVAYNDFEYGRCLVVQSIFDEDGYCFKQHIEGDALELTVIAAVPKDDGSTLTVEYYLGKSGGRTTVELPLS